MIRRLCLTLAMSLAATMAAWACHPTMVVTENDLLHPPAGMLAFRGKILKISPSKPLGAPPHDDFFVEFRVLKVFQGKAGRTMKIKYGPCHGFPGKVGDTVGVLGIQEKDGGFYVPMFWTPSK